MRCKKSKSFPHTIERWVSLFSNWFLLRSDIPRQARVFGINNIFAVESFEPAHREVGTSYSMEMGNERVIYDGAADCADDRNSLRSDLLRDDKSETGCHLRDEAHERRSPFFGNAMARNEACGARHAFRHRGSHSQIST